MAMVRRQRTLILALALYWLAIFVLTHIPIPEVIREAHVSDKSLHFLTYMILTFLFWSALKPAEKAHWHQAAAWLVLLVVMGYAVCDECLQYFVAGRSPDLEDLLANAVGALAGLAVVAVFSFRPASLVVTGVTIYTLTVFTRASLARLLPVTDAALHLATYGLFTLLWIGYMAELSLWRRPDRGWFVRSLIVPGALLLVTKVSAVISGKELEGWELIAATAGILGVIAAVSALRLALQRNAKRVELS
jgi:VanZ family protein